MSSRPSAGACAVAPIPAAAQVSLTPGNRHRIPRFLAAHPCARLTISNACRMVPLLGSTWSTCTRFTVQVWAVTSGRLTPSGVSA
jgi:hypothetical protein